MSFFGFGRLILEKADNYGKIADYCEARAKRKKPCLQPVALQQTRDPRKPGLQ
jgi:hypothetical protein